MSRLRQSSWLVLAAIFANSSSAQLFPLQEFPVATACNAAAFGDFNGDGFQDCVVANGNFDHASLLLARGDGSFEAPRTFGTADSFMELAIGNVDGDSNLDVVLFDGLARLELWLGDGAGGFTPHAMPIPSGQPSGIALGDITSDGFVDLIVAGGSGWEMAVFSGDGTGNFGAPTIYPLPAYPTGKLVAADLDGDLDSDVALLEEPPLGAPELIVYTNLGAGNLFPTASYPQVAGDLRAAHLNADTALDLIAGQGGQMEVLLNSGSGAFTVTPMYASSPFVSFDTADIDGDGDVDLATTGVYEARLTTLLNDGQGNFVLSATYPTGRTGILGLGRCDGDGAIDALTVGTYLQVQLGRGAGRFEALTPSPASLSGFGSLPAVAVADFDGDGSLDTAAVSGFSHSVNVALNDGSASFHAVWSLWLGATQDPRDVEAGDFDEDGRLDLVIVDREGDSLGWMRGLGGGAFAAPVYISVGLEPEEIAVVDFDGDTHLDAITTSNGASDIVVSRGDGHGNFYAPTPYPVGFGHPLALAVGDFDGDTKLDVAVGMSTFSPTLSLLLGDGLGGLGAPTSIATSPVNVGPVLDVEAADFDNDGHLDLACVNGGGGTELAFLFNKGAGDFTSPRTYGVRAEQARSLAVADFDGDGALDTAVTGYMAGPSIRLGTGQRAFSQEANYALPNDGQRSFAVADFDGDGRVDLLSSVGAGYRNFVSLNRGVSQNGACASEMYCYPSGNTAFSSGASLDASGSLSIGQNSFTLTGTHVVPHANGLFLYGSKRQAAPFGAGFLCVAGPALRLGPPQAADAQGALARTLDFTQPPLVSGPGQITPGVPWHFQLWFRDAASSHPSKVNLSTAVQATFCP